MSTKNSFGEYMTYLHTTELSQKFHSLEYHVKTEISLYHKALEEAYALKSFLSKKRDTAIHTIDEAHLKFIKTARDVVKSYDETYLKLDREWNAFAPKYLLSEKATEADIQLNTEKFHCFCNKFASKYGEWFWEISLKHDPLDDMNFGAITIRELQTYDCNSWYPHMDDWLAMPYGARLLELHQVIHLDLTRCILREKGLYEDCPSEELYNLLGMNS